MPAKPVTLPRWADVSGAIVVPGAGKLDVGWTTGERPPAQYLNWYQNLVYQWIDHLNDLLATGGGATDNLDTSGNANFGGTLGVGGIATFAALINANNGIAVPTTKHVTLVGTADLKHGDRVVQLTPGAFQQAGAWSAMATPRIENSAGLETAWRSWGASPNHEIVASIPLEVGDRIKSLRWYYNKASNAANLNMILYAGAFGAAISAVDNLSDTTAGAAMISTLRTLGTPYTLTAGQAAFLYVSSVTAAHEFYGVEITYDRP